MAKKLISNTFENGMNWDSLPELAEPSQYEYALNAVISDIDGNVGGLTSENSNYRCGVLPTGYIILGSASSFRDNIKEEILFLGNGSNSMIASYSSAYCKFTQLVSNACLNFNIKNPINALIKIKDNNDRIVYFAQDGNDYRVLNIDNLTDYNNNIGVFTCDKIKFSPNITKPVFNVKEVISGGQTKLGSYRAYLRYVNADLSETNIVSETEAFQITKSNYDSRYFSVDGGYNFATTGTGTNEQYNSSNKSVVFEATNLSDNFKYVYIEIVGKVAGSGAYSYAVKSELLPINNNSVKWTFTGNNVNITTTNEIIVDKVVLHEVKAHTQKDNRLFIANTTEDLSLAYHEIQQAALNLHVKWAATGVPKFQLVKGNAKNSISYTSLMRDEVYAIGIKGTMIDGKTTPVFHIPGRDKVNVPTGRILQNKIYETSTLDPTAFWDNRLLNITTGDTNTDLQSTLTVNPYEVAHLQNYIIPGIPNNTIEQWRVFNTAWIDSFSGTTYKGEMAYYETDVVYPTINTPTGLLYGTLTGNKIRHHKMPCTNVLLHVDNDYVYPLTIEVDLTNFLSTLSSDITSKVVSWEIVIAERTEDNKTIIDKGFTTWDETKRGSDSNYSYGLQVDPRVTRFYSPKILFQKANINPTHYKVEMYNSFKTILANTNISYDRQVAGTAARDWIREFYDVIGKFNSTITINKRLSNFKVNYSTYISDVTLIKDKQSWVQGLIPTVALKEAQRNYNYTPHSWNFLTSMGKLINNPLEKADGDATMQGFVTYGSIKNEHSVYENLSELTYLELKNKKNGNIYSLIEGDTFISPMIVELSSFVDYVNAYDGARPISGTLFDPVHDIHYMWVESDINVGMRHQKNVNNYTDNQLYYQGWISSDGTTATIQSPSGAALLIGFEEHLYLMNPNVTSSITTANMIGRLFKQALLFNVDYKYIASIKPYLSLNQVYNYTHINKRNLYKIRYSEKSFQDTFIDNYRVFLENNGVTQDAQFGEIRDLFVDKSELYSRTYKSILFIPTNTQTIKTNESTFYLGNAAVLPYEPKSINTLNHSYGGGYDFTHRLTTEFGTILIDIYTNKVFLLRDGLQDITTNFTSFFFKFLKWDLLDYNADSKSDKINLYFDTNKKRLLMTMHTWRIKDNFKNLLNGGNKAFTAKLLYDELTNTYILIDVNTGFILTSPQTLSQIADKLEYTLSYTFSRKSWTSFHSYIAEYGFETNKGFVQVSDNRFWNHQINQTQVEPYLLLNEVRVPFIIENTINTEPTVAKILDSVNIQSDNQEWSHIDAYTDKQHTGHQSLTLINQWNNATLNNIYSPNISNYEKYFRIDRLTDKIDDATVPIWTSNDRLTKIINTSNISTQDKMYQGNLRGKWIRVRLEYNTSDTNLKKQSIWLMASLVDYINR